MNQMQMQSTILKDKTYLLRFVTLHEGYGGGTGVTVVKPKGKKKETEAHYFGYVCNFATTQWFKLDDKDVDEVAEEDVLKNAQDKAYMLHYVLMGSEEYHQCYQEDISLCPSPKGSSVSSSNLAIADKTIGETVKLTDKMMGKETSSLKSTAADEIVGKKSTPKCSWSVSSKGCLMKGVHPKDVCGVDGCDSVFHHMCQTEWEFYQYHVDFPNGDPKDCIYDTGGKKRCIHHHPHSKLALLPSMPSTKESAPDKLLSTTQVMSESHSTTVVLETGKEASTKECSSAEVTKSLHSTVVLETKEPSTRDSVSEKLSEGTKSQHPSVVLETGKESSTTEGVSDQITVLETVKELSTKGVTDQILSTTQVLSQGTKSHPTTEYHPTPVGLETGKEPSTKEGAPDNLSEITKSQPLTVGKQTSAKEGVSDKMLSTTQVLSQGTKSHPTTVVLEPGKESNAIRMSTTSQERLPATKESYLEAIHEMYPEMIITKLSSYLPYFEDWAAVRAAAALKAFTAVQDMISHGDLVYDNRASLSDDDDDSDNSVASYMQKKPKKQNLDDEDKKFFTSLPTCYSLYFSFETQDATPSYCPFSSHNKCWQNKNSLEALLDGYECKSKPFKRDELGQHVRMSHSKSWCGEGVRIFLNEMYPSRLTANPLTQKKKSKLRMKKNLAFVFF
jgi:hypothetical protein